MIQAAMSIEQFLDQRYEMPEIGQWTELEDGQPVHLEPPDVDHGSAILNLSKALATYVHSVEIGYPCFDLGLVMRRSPDTLWFPAVSYFLSGRRFAESDNPFTTAIPDFVVEVLSTPLRRQVFDARVHRYFDRGTQLVWGLHPRQKTVEVRRPGEAPHIAASDEILEPAALLPRLSIPVASLYAEPEWYSRPAPRPEVE
jgi:Uma2 family endonuclease